MIVKQYEEGNYIITEYSNGAKTEVRKPENVEMPEIPIDPIEELRNDIDLIYAQMLMSQGVSVNV